MMNGILILGTSNIVLSVCLIVLALRLFVTTRRADALYRENIELRAKST